MPLTRVLIADDHALVRAGIRALTERIRDVEVVAETGNGREALRLIKELKPDLVLLDISMPEASGFDVLAQQAKEFPGVRVIVLTVHEAEAYAIRALRHGAAGFLLKSAASVELEQAIETVISGKTVETHRAQLMERLNIHDVAGLVRFAIKMGLVDVE